MPGARVRAPDEGDKPMNIRIAGVLLLSWPLVLHAAPADNDSDSKDTQPLKRVVVTANRTPRPQADTLAATTVITRADIERLQAESVTELLRRSPGINVANEGGPGKLTSVYMRGTESDHVLVLVDGVRYGDATSGIPAIQDLPVGQIERIEIVRGPRSSLYGADAIGGVIQIFTRDGGEGTKPYFSVGTGSHDRHQGRIGLSGGEGRLNYNVSYGLENTDGFDACDDFSACFTDEPDDDGYERIDASARVGYRFSDALRVNAHALHTRGDVEFDGSTTNESENTREVYGVSVTGRPADAWRVKLAAGHNRDESESFKDGTYVNTFETERDTLSLQNDITLAPGNLLTLGLDYRRDELTSNSDYKEDERDNKGVFAQYLGRWGRHELQLAGRGDDNEQFGEHATGSATYGFDITGRHTVSLSYGTAFKAPTFNELYFPDFPGFPPASNPDLDPVESGTYELGLDARQDWGRWSLHAYETHIDDLIVLDSVFTPQNISESRIRGVEAEVGTTLAGWLVNANATWLDAEIEDGPNEGNELPRRPDYSAQLDIDREFGRFSAGAGLTVAGDTYDKPANDDELDGYELVELRGGLKLAPDWRLQARISNLFNEDYETAAFYEQPGRVYFVTLRYQP